jgi:CubicO group peptidase (beta-lactamase class C family)
MSSKGIEMSRRQWTGWLMAAMALPVGRAGAQPVARALPALDAELKAIVNDPAMPLASLSVAAIRDGQVVYQGQFGFRQIDNQNAANNLPVTPATLFKVASVSKLVTAMGALRLVEQGKLDLEADASRYLGFALRNPHFPDVPITTRMLLSHTSSLRDAGGYTFALGPSLQSILQPGGASYGSGAQWAAPSADGERAPGKYFNYVNLNWGVLGTVMEAVSGQRFDRYMKAAILAPLGLPGHYNAEELTPAEVADLAVLYRKRTGETDWDPKGPWVAQTDDFHGKVPAPRDGLAGYVPGSNAIPFSPQSGLRTNATGLARLMRLLMNGGELDGVRLLHASSVRAMFTEQWHGDAAGKNGDNFHGLFNAWGLGAQHFLDIAAPGHGDRLVANGGFAGWGHLGFAYGLNAAFVLDPVRRNGLVYIVGGVGSDPDTLAGRYSKLNPWEEKIADALYRHAVTGAA